jgi:hypothetical protein
MGKTREMEKWRRCSTAKSLLYAIVPHPRSQNEWDSQVPHSLVPVGDECDTLRSKANNNMKL